MSDMTTHLVNPLGRVTLCCKRAISGLPKQAHNLTTEGSRVTCSQLDRKPKIHLAAGGQELTLCCGLSRVQLAPSDDLTFQPDNTTCTGRKEPKMTGPSSRDAPTKIDMSGPLMEVEGPKLTIPPPPRMNYVEASRMALQLAFKYAETSGRGSAVSEILDDATEIRGWLTS